MVDLPRPSFMDKTPRELGIGTWNNVRTIDQDTPLITVMDIFLAERVSALPVLNKDDKVSFNSPHLYDPSKSVRELFNKKWLTGFFFKAE